MQTAATGHDDILVGRSLEGRYRILERIARGGMSTVYAAVDERLDRLVAVKVMSAALSADPNFSDRFAREARAAARLTHLNVVSVYDQGHDRAPDGHHVFLVMELVEGRTLRELIRERGRLTPAEAVSIMEPVLSALAAAHRAGLVHRDVKPENILLSDDGIVKVADFGLARAVEADAESTRTGLMMGTVAYCAPETISKGVADPRSDVYAAGVVLFELLTGTPPYSGDTAMNVAYQHVHSRVPAPSSRVRGLPEELDEVVVAATDSDPDGRPADAAALLAELADVRTELGLPVTPVPRRARPRTRTPRPDHRRDNHRDSQHRTPDAATTGLIHQGVPGRHDTSVVPDGRPGARPAPQPRDDAPPPPVVIPPGSGRSRRKRRAWIVVIIVLIIGVLAGTGGWWLSSHYFKYVPKVVGKSEADARARLKHAGYKVKVEPGPVNSETIGKGDVVSIDPSGGSRLTKGKTVTLTLSAGARLYKIPDVRTLTAAQAIARLKATGPLKVDSNLKSASSDTVAKNEVIRTDPAAGTMVTQRRVIVIYVSTGPPIVDVPVVDPGTSVDDAKAKYAAAGFPDVDASQQEYSSTIHTGDVISCVPSGGQAVKGTKITCTVSKGPQTVNVPHIATGTPAADAKKALTDAGLVPSFVGGDGTSGAVIAISPGGGTEVSVGSTVTVFIVGG